MDNDNSAFFDEINFLDKKNSIGISRRHLPHWHQDGVVYYVTFRLADSIPQEKLSLWINERYTWLKKHPEPLSVSDKIEYFKLFPERIQKWLDSGMGSCCLKYNDVAKIAANTLKFFDNKRYILISFVIMPNHIHVIVTPIQNYELSKILQMWKSYSAREINKKLNREGTLWQSESFDHIIRSPEQLRKVIKYIKDNPKNASLENCIYYCRFEKNVK